MANFRERLLQVMDRKDHWGWKILTGPAITKQQLIIHFQQEYEVYVRDFPLLLSRVLGRMDPEALTLKREFAENIYEEQTGGLSKEVSRNLSHPELFLKMMRGLQYRDRDFLKIPLLPTSLAYRSYIDLVTLTKDWRIGAALLTLFVEGSIEDRLRLGRNYKNTKTLSSKLKNHSLHKFHGLSLKNMDLVRAHHMIEGSHRKSAWETTLKFIPKYLEDEVITAMENALDLWQLFRDGVCVEMNVENPEFRSLVR